ncbi:MAG: ChaN family lipoprotein [Polyangiaceae bacterium]|nr:ChaN family lipoprotein [Polyangiaceae bacterium]
MAAVIALSAWGCAETPAATTPVGCDSAVLNEPRPAPSPAPPRRPHSLPADVVERAARDFQGLRADGEALSPEELLGEIGRASVLCIGEEPAAPHHHWMELTVIRELHKRAPARGIELGLGLTIFAARDQRWLDQYAAGELGERDLLGVTHYQDNWELDFALYRPLVEYAVSRGVALVGLNAPSELVNRVASGGLEALPPEQAESLPELDLDNPAHRRAFDQDGSRVPAAGVDADNAYSAEVLSEETVAEHAARWVTERRPARQLLVIARAKQCERTAIPARIARRGVARALSLCPLAEPQGTSPRPGLEGFDYGFVMGPPGVGATND